MSNERSKFGWWLWQDNVYDALEGTGGKAGSGGVLTVDATGVLLNMSPEEIEQRLDDRSILAVCIAEMSGPDDILIPAFQFEGRFHIPAFHDLWDILAANCTTERVCQFFVHETLEEGGPCIREVLCSKPSDDAMKAITLKAEVFSKQDFGQP